jgi:hypothetical protein
MLEKIISKQTRKAEKQPNYKARQIGAGAIAAVLLLAGAKGGEKLASLFSHRMDQDRIANPQRGNPSYAEDLAQKGMSGEVKNENGEVVRYHVEANDTPSELVERFGGTKEDVDAIAKQGEADGGYLEAGQGITVPADMAAAVKKYNDEQAELASK